MQMEAMRQKSCFVIGPIGEPDSKTREWSDTIIEYIIEPAVTECGYSKPFRADHIAQPGEITVDIIRSLMNDDLVIADLTERNANVYYELAIRHAVKKPCVLVIQEGEKHPFDTKDSRAIRLSIAINKAKKATEELKKYITAAQKQGPNPNTLISFVSTIDLMKASGDAQQGTIADVLEAVQDMKADMNRLEQRLPQPKGQGELTVTPSQSKRTQMEKALIDAFPFRINTIQWKRDGSAKLFFESEHQMTVPDRDAIAIIAEEYGVRLEISHMAKG